VLRGVEGLLARLAGPEVEMDLDLCPEPVEVVADPGGLEQIAMNLTANARDAVGDGGRITMRTRILLRHAADAAPDGPAMAGEYVELAVADDGCGMDPETKERIFDPFFTTKDRDKGTGLGLSTVYGIVTQSDGSIAVESEPGRGTTFRIFLPKRAE